MHKPYNSGKAGISKAPAVLAAVCMLSLSALGSRGAPAPKDPWAASQLITPETLAKEVAAPKSEKPRIVCVGFEVLYHGAHIPGAKYAGPARQSTGIAELKRWAASVPKNAPIVVYCGCCPMNECPNVRPAFNLLRREGFTRLRVLDLPDSFAKDWVEKGYPTVRGE
jgi:thiosulfate/3-mercaptopyruvate sulfurtransferase